MKGAVQERPQCLPLRTQWATALLNAGEAQRAREVLEEGSAGNSRSTRALYLLSEAQRRTRDFAAAEVTARRLIALDARALGGPQQLAHIFRDQNEHQKIVALLEPIVTPRLRAADAADMTSETFRSLYFDLAKPYESLRQFDKAITHAQAGSYPFADGPAGGNQAGPIARGKRQGRRCGQDAAGGGHEVPQGNRGQAAARLDAGAPEEI